MLYTPISLENNTFLLTECIRAILGILAQGCGSVDQAQQGFTKMTWGKYSPVWLEQAKLVSSLLNAHGPNVFILNLLLFQSKYMAASDDVSVETICMAESGPSKNGPE